MKRQSILAVCALVWFVPLRCVDAQEVQSSGPTELWRVREDLRIGEVVGDEKYTLSHVSDLTVGPTGEIYVVQPQEQSVRVYDPDGRFLDRIGRKGAGPGEFAHPTETGWYRDTLWVLDQGLSRIQLFSPEGTFIASLTTTTHNDRPFMLVRPKALLDGRTLLSRPSVPSHLIFSGRYQKLPLLRVGQNGRTDTLAWLDVRDRTLRLSDPDQPQSRVLETEQPIGGGTLFALVPGGAGIVFGRAHRWIGPAFPGHPRVC